MHCLQIHTSQNAAIAREALELLVTCLKLRPHLLNMFYTLTHIGDFIIDILLGSPHTDIRLSVVDQLLQLCSISTGEVSCDYHMLSFEGLVTDMECHVTIM